MVSSGQLHWLQTQLEQWILEHVLKMGFVDYTDSGGDIQS